MLSKYKVLYSLKVQKQTKSVIAAIKKIESSDKEEYTDDEVAAIHKKVLGLDYDHASAYGLRSKEDNEMLRELKKTGFVTAMIFTVIRKQIFGIKPFNLTYGEPGLCLSFSYS